MRTSRGDPQRGNERERERMIWRTWNATAADTTRVSIKPPQARKSRDVEIPAATGVPSGGGAGRPNSLCLWYNDPPSFSPRLCFPQPPPPPYIYGRSTCTSGYAGRRRVAKSRHRFPVKIYCDLVRIYSPRLYSILKKRRGDMRVYFRDR